MFSECRCLRAKNSVAERRFQGKNDGKYGGRTGICPSLHFNTSYFTRSLSGLFCFLVLSFGYRNVMNINSNFFKRSKTMLINKVVPGLLMVLRLYIKWIKLYTYLLFRNISEHHESGVSGASTVAKDISAYAGPQLFPHVCIITQPMSISFVLICDCTCVTPPPIQEARLHQIYVDQKNECVLFPIRMFCYFIEGYWV